MNPQESLNSTKADDPTSLKIRPRSERNARLARIARPRLVDRANKFFETYDGSHASFNAFTETHERFILAIRPEGRPADALGVSFVTCMYLAGPTFWSGMRLRCKSVEDINGALMYEVADLAAGFVVRCATIVSPTHNLTFADEWSRELAD